MSDEVEYLKFMHGKIALIEASQLATGGAPLVPESDHAEANLRRLALIGEASKHLSPELKEAHPEIEWRELVGLRNHLDHNLLSLSMGTVQDVLDQDLPPLREVVGQELARHRQLGRDDDVGLGL